MRRALESPSRYAFFNFAKTYLAAHNTVPRDFEVTTEVMGEFLDFIKQPDLGVSADDVRADQENIARRIKQELIAFIYGRPEGDRVQLRSDALVLKAIELAPQAKALADGAKRITAQRFGGR